MDSVFNATAEGARPNVHRSPSPPADAAVPTRFERVTTVNKGSDALGKLNFFVFRHVYSMT